MALEKLKEQDGPFTDAEQVEVYLSLKGIDEKERRKRLKLEIQYDRDTSTLLPKFILFSKLKKYFPNGKLSDKSSEEFAKRFSWERSVIDFA